MYMDENVSEGTGCTIVAVRQDILDVQGGSQTRCTGSTKVAVRQPVLDVQGWQSHIRYWMYRRNRLKTGETRCTGVLVRQEVVDVQGWQSDKSY